MSQKFPQDSPNPLTKGKAPWRKVSCDIETNGLDVNRCIIWCIVCIDLETREVFKFHGETLKDFRDFTREVARFVGHNFISFDAPILNRVFGVALTLGRIHDTLVLSRLAEPMIQGGHGLSAWGKRLEFPKTEHKDWATFSEEMLTYCVNDTELTLKLYFHLLEKLKGFSVYSVEMEHEVAHILNQQRRGGFFVNKPEVLRLLGIMNEKRDEILKNMDTLFPPKVVCVASNWMPRRTKEGGYYAADMNKLAKYRHVAHEDGTYELYESIPFNMGSPSQIVERMNEAGWKPVVFTPTGNPSACEENFETLPAEAADSAKKIVEYKLYTNRIATLEGWLEHYNEETKRIHGSVIGTGTITHRMAHHSPQMGNIPAIRYHADKTLVPNFARELRACWTVEDLVKYCMVGTDIAGIQLCILAHYLENPTYINALASGTKEKGNDMHTLNMNILREIAPLTTRDNAKTFIYALLLGAGGGKLGSILGVGKREGNAARELLTNRVEGFDRIKRMCSQAAKRGYMTGLDGRRIAIKSEHYALSAYLQGGEAVVMKQALIFTRERACHLDWRQLMVVHDEIQSQVLKTQADELGKLQIQAMADAGVFFDLRCPISGEYRVGNNWSETH
jgi:DNA polymerase-1